MSWKKLRGNRGAEVSKRKTAKINMCDLAAFPARAYMNRAVVHGNGYKITFRRVGDPLKELSVIVVALNIEDAVCKVKASWANDFSHLIHAESLNLMGIG